MAITASPGTPRRRAQLIVDHYISHGRLVEYGGPTLEDAITNAITEGLALPSSVGWAREFYDNRVKGKTLVGDEARFAVHLGRVLDYLDAVKEKPFVLPPI